MYEEKFADRLAQLRIAKGVSARDMSLSIGQNPGYINNIESGKAMPSMSVFFFICEYLGITPSEFFDYENASPEKMGKIFADMKRLNQKQLDSILVIVDEFLK